MVSAHNPQKTRKATLIKKPQLPSLRRVLGLLLLFAAVGLTSCQALVVSLGASPRDVSPITRGLP